MTKKIIVADMQHLFLAGLQCLLMQDTIYQYETIFKTSSGKQLLDQLTIQKLDLLIMDISLIDKDGFEVLDILKKKNIDFKILLLSGNTDPNVIRKISTYTIDGLLLKTSKPELLFEALQTIFLGKKYFDPNVPLIGIGSDSVQKLNLTIHANKFENDFIKNFEITKRELEVLILLAKANSNKDIGKALFISEQTVTVHRKSLMRKLCVNNIASMMKIAYENNLI